MRKEDVQSELKSLERRLDEGEDRKDYEDLARSPVPPELQQEPETRLVPRQAEPRGSASWEARRMMSGLRSMRKLVEKSSWLKSKRMLGWPETQVPKARARKRRVKAIMDGAAHQPEQMDVGPPEDGAPEQADEDFWREVRNREEAYDQEVRSREGRRRHLLDDFPRAALKRGQDEFEEPPLAKRVKSSFYATVMLAVSQHDLPNRCAAMFSSPAERRANEWVSRSELRRLRRM